jgi:hypothetical protein
MKAAKPQNGHADLMSPAQVCKEYPIFTPASLADRRWRGDGPEYIKTSPGRSGRVFYRRSAIEQWLNDRTVRGAAA